VYLRLCWSFVEKEFCWAQIFLYHMLVKHIELSDAMSFLGPSEYLFFSFSSFSFTKSY